MKVIGEPDGMIACLLGGLSDAGHRFIGFNGIFDAGQIHGQTLGQQNAILHALVSTFSKKFYPTPSQVEE
jgi:coproporphyrinogen III oxidase